MRITSAQIAMVYTIGYDICMFSKKKPPQGETEYLTNEAAMAGQQGQRTSEKYMSALYWGVSRHMQLVSKIS